MLLGNGDGTFQPQVTYAVGSGAFFGIAAGDFNGNGRLDLAVSGGGEAMVLLGNGDGTFQAEVPYAVGSAASAIVAGDFNGDGHVDLAVTTYGDNNNDVSILLGDGDGTFQPQSEARDVVGSSPNAIVAGDFNGEGRTDLAVANSTRLQPDNVSILLGNGDGTRSSPRSQYAVVGWGRFQTPSWRATSNGDGRPGQPRRRRTGDEHIRGDL